MYCLKGITFVSLVVLDVVCPRSFCLALRMADGFLQTLLDTFKCLLHQMRPCCTASRKMAFMRGRQPSPVFLKASTTSASI